MNCCDDYGNCRQGRDCPIRVAHVGARYPKYAEPLFTSTTDQKMKMLVKWVLVAILCWLLVVPLIYLSLRA